MSLYDKELLSYTFGLYKFFYILVKNSIIYKYFVHLSIKSFCSVRISQPKISTRFSIKKEDACHELMIRTYEITEQNDKDIL